MTMVARADQVLDDHGKPVLGASIYVYDSNGNSASLTSDGATALPQPLITDEFGNYSYQALVGYYREDIWYGAKLRYRENNIALGNPGADLALRSDLAAITGASLVTTKRTETGAVARTLESRLRDTVIAEDFGAVGDGVTDDYAALQAALNTGKVVRISAKTYLTSNALNVTHPYSGLLGEGYGSVIKTTSATADIFTLGDGTNEIPGLLFRSFRVWSTVTKTAGYVFNGRFVSYSRFEDIGCGTITDYGASGSTHKLFKGYAFNGFAQCGVSGGEIVTASDCVTINGKTGQTWGYELYFGGGMRLFGSGGSAFYLGGSAGGVRLGELDVSLCQHGFNCDTLISGENNRELFLSPLCSIDTCTDWGGYIASNGLSLLRATGAWIAGCGQPTGNGGLKLATGATTKVDATGIRIYANYGDGVELNGGDGDFTGAQFDGNGAKAGGGYGIKALTGLSRLVVDGATVRNSGNVTVGYNIYVGTGVDNFSITNNDVTGGGQGALTFPGGLTLGPTKIVRANRGYKTEAQGQATITAGNTTVTVTHGMDTAPQYPMLVGIGQRNAACVQNLTSTTFQIAIGSTVGSDIAFQWSMRADS